MFRPVFAVLLCAGTLLPLPSLFAQKTASPPPSLILKPPPIDTRRAPNQQDVIANRGAYITGRVQLDDGMPLTTTIVIEKICGGSRTPVAYTDMKGHFSFQVGGMNAVMPDASESWSGFNAAGQPTTLSGGTQQSPGDRLLSCELTAVLPGYRSDVAYLGQHRQLDNPDIGTLVLHRLMNVPGTTISATTINAPKDALKAFNKGLDDLKKAKSEPAEKEFRRAVELHPKFAAAWYQLGHMLSASDTPGAREALRHAIDADGKYVSPYLDLALIEIREHQWPAALDAASKGVHLDPVDFPQLYFYKAIAEFNTKQMDEAEKSARQADKIDVAHRLPKIQQLLGMVLIEKQDYTGAAEYLRTYLRLAPDAGDAPAMRTQLSQIEKVATAAPRP